VTAEERQAVLDEEHLRLLALLHYVSGGITVAFGLFFAAWIAFAGTLFALLPAGQAAARHPQGPPIVFFIAFGVFALIAIGYGVLEIISGRLMSLRHRWLFSFIVSLPRVLFIPYGTILTIFTLLVLDRPSVKNLYR
jgi:hypothetical protein